MLIGLRKAWLQSLMNEEPSAYQAEPSAPGFEALFHHESLDVYRAGLDFMRWFVGLPGGKELSDRLCWEVDKSATSVVLNVAEGNGRYSELDHRRFLEITVKMEARGAPPAPPLLGARPSRPQQAPHKRRARPRSAVHYSNALRPGWPRSGSREHCAIGSLCLYWAAVL